MADDIDNTPAESPPEKSGPLAGERLAAARRERQISVLEIAKELHLDEGKVRALERNDFDFLGAPVFAKGHLRKYAELVNVPVEDILVDYYGLTRSAEMPPVVLARPRPRRELSPGPWIAVIVVIVVAATAYWLLTNPSILPTVASTEDAVPAEPASSESAPAEMAALPDETEAEAAEPEATEPEVAEPRPQARPPVVEETESPDIPAGQMRLLLTYSGDCWTEVTDATGRRLFFALGTDGRTVELGGAEPFNVLLGNPGNVALEVNGDEYALPDSARPDRPLRLTLSGS